jgi:glycosidase
MNKEAIFHKMDKEYAYALSKDLFLIKIRTKKDDLKSIKLYYCDKYLRKYKHKQGRLYFKEMSKVFSDELYDYYEIEISIDVICLRYFFKLEDNNKEILYYGNYRFYKNIINDIGEMFDLSQQVRVEEIFDIPSWANGAIVYQIFPDRFSRTNEDTSGIWYDPPKRFSRTLYGGTLKGISQHISYIKDLGVQVIYLTPIFKSSSDHKYNTDDYMQIDPDFGTEEDLKELIDICHKNDIKIILDGVFNHSGFMFEPFQDVIKNQENSKYKDWYYINKYPVELKFDITRKQKPNWLTFGYAAPMPKLNTSNKEVREYIFNVATKYLKLGVDGWRLDVADEISHDFWKEFRKVVKSVNEDALIIGEVWYESTPWLLGDEYDTVMNYEFTRDIGLIVNNKNYKCSDFVNDISFLLGRVHKNVRNVLWNLIDSHDTPRFITSSRSKKKLMFALAMQMVLPGMPMIYYGDEIGMEGKKDPDCRRGMIWDKNRQDHKLLNYYKKWINIRKNSKALQKGTTTFTNIDDDNKTFEIVRTYKKETKTIFVDAKNFVITIK